MRARNDIGEGGAASVTETPNALPDAPARLSAQPASTRVVLTWTDPNDASIDKYQQRRRPDGGAWTAWADIDPSDKDTTTHTATGLVDGTAYTFEVRAVNSTGEGGAASVPATPNPVPAAPAGLAAAAGAARAELSWTDPNDSSITGYEVRHRTRTPPMSAWSGWAPVPGSGPATVSHTVTGLPARTEHAFEVRARNPVGAGAAASVETTRPAAPANLAGAPADKRVELGWDHPGPADIAGYEHRMSTDGGNTWNPDWTAVPASGPSTVSHTVTGLVNGTVHTFEVRAVNALGAGGAARASAVPSLLPAAPAGLAADNGADGEAELGWDDPDNASITGYEYRASADGGNNWSGWNLIPGAGPATVSHTVTGLLNAVEQTIELRARNSTGPGPAAAAHATPLESLYQARSNILLRSTTDDGFTGDETVAEGARAAQAFRTGPHPLGYRLEQASVHLEAVRPHDRVSVAVHADDGSGRPGGVLHYTVEPGCCDEHFRGTFTDGVNTYWVSRTHPRTRTPVVPHLHPHTTYHIVATTTAGSVQVKRRAGTGAGTGTDAGWTLGAAHQAAPGATWTPAPGRLAIDIRGAPMGPAFPPVAVHSPTSVTVPHNADIGHSIATVQFSPGGLAFTAETDYKEPDQDCLGRIRRDADNKPIRDPDTGNATRAAPDPSVCLFNVTASQDGTTATVKLNHRLDCNRKTRYTIIIRAKQDGTITKDHALTMHVTGC